MFDWRLVMSFDTIGLMKQLLCLVFFTSTVVAAPPVTNLPSYNNRTQYTVGVHVNGGGATGGVGMSADMHGFKDYALSLKAGTGIYFNAMAFETRYYVFETSLSPYISLGLARWSQAGNPSRLKDKFSPSEKLGLVTASGAVDNNSIILQTGSVGLHYLSEFGFSISAEGTLLFSYASKKLQPWAGLSLGWYF